VEEAMNKVIRLVVSGLSLCGALAVLPGIAEARDHDRGHERGGERGWGRDHGRFEHGRGYRDGRYCR
jgi:hypothetical protein